MLNAQIYYFLRVRHIHVEVHTKRRRSERFYLANALVDLSGCHHSTGQKAKSARLARGCHKLRVGDPAHSRLNDGIATPQQLR